MEIYRRIADIRSYEDCSDVIDELIDRFGDPPASVKGLIDVALLRNLAVELGIHEIKQNGLSLLIYPNRVDMRQIAALISSMKGRVMLSAGSKPYISIKMLTDTAPLEILEDVLNTMKTAIKEQEKNQESDQKVVSTGQNTIKRV